MQPHARPDKPLQRAFGVFPLELFLNVLDQLVGTSHGRPPIAYAPSDAVTRALRALTLVSRTSYLVASRYLYANCLYLNDCTNYARLRRTVGLDLGRHPQALQYGEAGRNNDLFHRADIPRFITSLFMSPHRKNADTCPMVRLPQIIDLGCKIAPTLKRLAIDMQPVYTTRSEVLSVKPHTSANNIFLHMPNLEELVCSYDVTDYFPHPPPNLKRLASTFQGFEDVHLDFCFAISSLEFLVCLRPEDLQASHIDKLFERYNGHHLDVVLVDVNANHAVPINTRDWKDDDTVKVWELDVPKSYYGDEDDLVLCDSWIWQHGVQGTLWTQEKRRMLSWSEIDARITEALDAAEDDIVPHEVQEGWHDPMQLDELWSSTPDHSAGSLPTLSSLPLSASYVLPLLDHWVALSVILALACFSVQLCL
ncbi:hypothetical protein CC80DRAFT_495104 [Byssothecium circinans]|uniref:Uncharacterized protein n=1 Tax=Byssothecium circinans TaxID=147558 RepID=A0A6A5TLH6_9PLEO|nr:hypothetical protein CC80DRAFT_495104 [Byssothecium circinans]